MAKIFILVKRKGAKRFSGAIPVKRGVSKNKIQMLLRRQLKKGFSARVVSEKTLKSVINRQVPRSKSRRGRKK